MHFVKKQSALFFPCIPSSFRLNMIILRFSFLSYREAIHYIIIIVLFCTSFFSNIFNFYEIIFTGVNWAHFQLIILKRLQNTANFLWTIRQNRFPQQTPSHFCYQTHFISYLFMKIFMSYAIEL